MKIIKRLLIGFSALILTLVLIVTLLYCRSVYIYSLHRYSMVSLANRMIPGYSKSVHDDLRIEETDEYGRYLFSVDHGNPSAKHAFIIVQKEDRENKIVYYYSENSTLLVDDLWNLSEEDKKQLELLKQKNDWNQPLQEDKMTALSTENFGR